MQLAIRLETWKHTAGVVVIEELSTQFQIEFAMKLRDTFLNMFRLNGLILLIVKTYNHIIPFWEANLAKKADLLINPGGIFMQFIKKESLPS